MFTLRNFIFFRVFLIPIFGLRTIQIAKVTSYEVFARNTYMYSENNFDYMISFFRQLELYFYFYLKNSVYRYLFESNLKS